MNDYEIFGLCWFLLAILNIWISYIGDCKFYFRILLGLLGPIGTCILIYIAMEMAASE